MLKAEGKITDVIIENMMNWRHSGFNVYCGKAIWPHNEEGLENLARYIIRASFSQERMSYYALSVFGSMKIISFIEDSEVIKKILKHLELWDVRPKPPPCANPEADRICLKVQYQLKKSILTTTLASIIWISIGFD